VIENLIRFGVAVFVVRRRSEGLSARRQGFPGPQLSIRKQTNMPARETEAIILKTFPLGEADRLVSFFGRSSGRLRGVAAGARRIKNRYGSTLEVLSHVQLHYVERETRDLVRIQECELLESFHRAQSDYGLSTGLAVISEIAERTLPEQEVSEPMFRLLLLAAREVERRGSWELPLAYFAFWTVKLGGYLPPLDRCASCGSALGEHAGFHFGQSGALSCESCRKPGMRAIGKPGRELAGISASRSLDQMILPQDSGKAIKELREAALDWIEYHVERRLQTREFLETT
jgi:DNA repair protein RecO (recombination protein O)